MRKPFYLHRRNGIWYAEFRDPLTDLILPARSSGLKNKTAAELWANQELNRLVRYARYGDMRFGDWAKKFYQETGCPHLSRVLAEGGRCAERTRAQNRRLIEKHILPDPVCGKRVSEIQKPDALGFRNRLVESLGFCRTSQLVFGLFRTMCLEAVVYGLVEADPCFGLKRLSYESAGRKALTLDQVLVLMKPESWDTRLYWKLTMCSVLTGMRAGEVRALQWEDVDLPAGRIHVIHNLPAEAGASRLTEPKWGKTRTAPYSVVLQRILEPERLPSGFVFSWRGGPIGYSRWRKAFSNVCTISGCEGATIHSLRHSLHTILRERGVPPDVLRASFGWESEKVQEGYTHRELYDLSPEKALIDSIFSNVGGV